MKPTQLLVNVNVFFHVGFNSRYQLLHLELSIEWDFLWFKFGFRFREGSRGYLIGQNHVCGPKCEWGLGIGLAFLRHKALFAWWLWRFPMESDSL